MGILYDVISLGQLHTILILTPLFTSSGVKLNLQAIVDDLCIVTLYLVTTLLNIVDLLSPAVLIVPNFPTSW
ncbi:hypothetical protein B9Z19DRAFT_208302 [Tuber borchii]|uniref:Uncharacterized protein n=1 Tax=Tuber borchii TaxID=42251 RepID=A0A2T6ZNA2_TUBBO|nr:hypothetical protein B9Z19DRAFT_208302 [Tuber borchii]